MTAPSPAGLSPLLDQLDEAQRVWKEGGLGAAAAALFIFPEAIPQLTAALRAVEALAEELANPGLHAGLNNVAARIRAAIAAPVAGQHTTDEEGPQ